MHGSEFTVVVIAGVALIVGAAMRLVSKKTHFPYTIGMLLVGIVTGILIRKTGAEAGHGVLSTINDGSHLAPELIIFVFLPALVFESAFAVDVNEFRKSLGAITVYAVPALVLSTLLIGAMAVGVTSASWQWGWGVALVFGALISATDPVAVVAIFSELGVPKRLGVLVEGESLLNDGTSIVIFTLLVEILTGEIAEFSGGQAALRFLVVVAGGVGVGIVLAWVLSRWIEEMFNDPLSEITLTMVLAYSCMAIAEGMLHVSGVMAVVTSGLFLSATGKRKISPEIQEFLHRFWQVLGYIANTLIFFLVGLVIAREFDAARPADFLLIFVVYVGAMLVRGLLTFGFQPLANRLSDGVTSKDSLVITWGGLRGAVSLALGLLVAENDKIDETIRHQVLLLTAGVVLLTILVNGSTTGKLLSKLGYDKPPLSEQVATLSARSLVLEDVTLRIDEVSQSRDLRTVDWREVRERLEQRRHALDDEAQAARAALERAPERERVAGYIGQALDLETQAYWESFAQGTLGANAVRLLVSDVDRQRDRLQRGDLALPPSRTARLVSALFGGRRGPAGFEQIALSYDLYRAESLAADRVLSNLNALKGARPETLERIKNAYQTYLSQAKERLEDLRTNQPEMARAVETRLARRIELNFEREGLLALERRGVLDHHRVHTELHSVEHRMASLRRMSERVPIPETAELVAQAPLFRELNPDALRKLADLTEEMLIGPDDYLFRQGDPGDALYVIARGAVHVLLGDGDDERLLDVLGGGDVVGEMSLLTGAPRTASARAKTSVTLGKIDRARFEDLAREIPELATRIWQAFAERRLENTVHASGRFSELSRDTRRTWIRSGTLVREPRAKSVATDDANFVFVATGSVRLGEKEHPAPRLVECTGGTPLEVTEACTLLLLKRPEAARDAKSSQTDPAAGLAT